MADAVFSAAMTRLFEASLPTAIRDMNLDSTSPGSSHWTVRRTGLRYGITRLTGHRTNVLGLQAVRLVSKTPTLPSPNVSTPGLIPLLPKKARHPSIPTAGASAKLIATSSPGSSAALNCSC